MPENLTITPVIKAELEPDEKLLWSGQPGALNAALPTIPVFIFALIWTAFSALFVWVSFGTTKSGQPLWFMSIIGVPFLLIGLLLLTSPFYAFYLAKKTFYAVTDRNLYVIKEGKDKTVEKYSRADLINPIRTESGGRGTLKWSLQGEAAKPSYRKKNTSGELIFADIENPRQLEKLLRETENRGS